MEGQYTIPDDVHQAFQDLRLRRRFRWITVGLDEEAMQFFLDTTESEKSKNIEHLAKDLPETESRYVVYDHYYETADGRKTDKLYFIMWSPSSCSTVVNMKYLHARPVFRQICDGCYDLSVASGSELQDEIRKDITGAGEEEFEENDDWMDQ